MDALCAALEAAGFTHVHTLLQSGNAVVGHEGTKAQVEAGVRGVLESRFDLDVAVLVRDGHAWAEMVTDNPLGSVATDGSKHYVVFCSHPHDPARLPQGNAPEKLVARPMELHVWCPQGVRDGMVMTALGRRPPAPVTSFCNWNTVAKLGAMVQAS